METIDELKERVITAKEFLKTKEGNICIVSHNSFLKQFLFDDIGDITNELKHCYPYEYKL